MSEQQIEQLSPARNAPAMRSDLEKLTPTQFKVLQGVHSGLANKQIAFDLGISEATVKAHMTALMRKLNATNRTQVAILAEKLAMLGQISYPEDAISSFN